MLLTTSYSESAYPIIPVENFEFLYIFLLYIHINNNRFTYDKFKSPKFGFNILDMF